MMSRQSKREVLDTVRSEYYQASRPKKTAQLDQLVALTHYNRKYLIHLLKHPSQAGPRRKRRGKSRYTLPVKAALVAAWKAENCICAKRLVPFMGEIVDALERHHELQLSPETRELLLQMSVSTAERLLRGEREHIKRHGLGTTKPGTLKNTIPIRTFADWGEKKPGFVEVDLVAHCGDTTAGEYLHTLVLVDVATSWTEMVGLPNRGQRTVAQAIALVRKRFPFPLLGIDSDNGGEFINDILARYCKQEQLEFTRSRPYKKNDQAYVEQKNWTAVRQMLGYDRYAGPKALARLEAVYKILCPYFNFFQPVMKTISKQRVGSHVTKKYDTAMTPFRRVMAAPQPSADAKGRLEQRYLSLNPAALLRQIHELQTQFWALSQSQISQ
jgi:hypothetical protein